MTDRELLEAAAKAAGMHAQMWAEPGELLEKGGWVQFIGHGHASVWNPLTDDGDALRLAVKLGMHCVDAFPVPSMALIKECDGDEYAATRRAIVRAAAALATPKPAQP